MEAKNETLQAYLALLRAKVSDLVSGIASSKPGLHGATLHGKLDELEQTLKHARAAAVSAGHRP
jgi:hypothetical protein